MMAEDSGHSVVCLIPALFDLQLLSDSRVPVRHLDRLARCGVFSESQPVSAGERLQRLLGFDQRTDFPVSALRLAGLGGEPGDAVWAQLHPVHFRADRDRLLLFPLDADDAGLSGQSSLQLLATLNNHFAEPGYHFELLGSEWFMRFDRPLDVTTSTLAEAQRRGVDEALPHGNDALLLRSLLNEIQMLMAQQVPPGQQALFNGFWISGVGSLQSLSGIETDMQFAGDSALLTGLRQTLGQMPVSEDAIEWSRSAVVLNEERDDTDRAIQQADRLIGHLMSGLPYGRKERLIIADEAGHSLVYRRPLVYPFWRRGGWCRRLEANYAAWLRHEQGTL